MKYLHIKEVDAIDFLYFKYAGVLAKICSEIKNFPEIMYGSNFKIQNIQI